MTSIRTKGQPKGVNSAPDYSVPALEKGLDVLECLSATGAPLTQAQLARKLDRGPNELFRMLTCLERRGYVERDETSGAYSLTLRLFELSHAHSPFQGLVRAAERHMRALTEEIHESVHLSTIHRGQLLVLAQEESPAKFRVSVEVGGVFSILHTVSGRLLLAHMNPDRRASILNDTAEFRKWPKQTRVAFVADLQAIQNRGYETATGESLEGVIDLATLVGAPDSQIQAALTIASLRRNRRSFVEDMLPALKKHAAAITQSAGIEHG